VIDVVEEGVDRLDALKAAAFDEVPFRAVEDARDEVERDQPFGRAALGIDGKGDAEPAKQLLRRVLLGDERLDREIVEEARKRGISRPDVTAGRTHLIEELAGKRGRLIGLRIDPHPLSTLRQGRLSSFARATASPASMRFLYLVLRHLMLMLSD
jgi:hypothetical protein